MGTAIATAVILILPLVFSGTVHMWVVRKNWLASLARPIDERAFGRNKTWRGFVVMPLATIPGVLITRGIAEAFGADVATALASASSIVLGLLLGLGYVLAELPNSYLKRRVGIEPGRPAEQHRFWFVLLDQADSAIGCAVVYALLLDVSVAALLLLVLLAPAIHLGMNVLLYTAGLREEAL